MVGPAIFPLVIFPLVILPSEVLMFCAFTEFRPIIAIIPIIAARIGMIKTSCFLRAFLSALLTYKGLEVIATIETRYTYTNLRVRT